LKEFPAYPDSIDISIDYRTIGKFSIRGKGMAVMTVHDEKIPNNTKTNRFLASTASVYFGSGAGQSQG